MSNDVKVLIELARALPPEDRIALVYVDPNPTSLVQLVVDAPR